MIFQSKPIIGEEEKKAVMEVLNSGMLAQGPKVKELEEKFAELCGVKHAIAMNSGTAAVHASLYAIGIKPDDEVITSPFSFIASASPIAMLGAKIIFADVKEDTFNIDPKGVEKKITDKTKVIVAVDLYGQPADYKRLREVAEKHNIKVVEDACQAVNAEFDEKKTGSLGDIAAFSLYATKNVMCGEGGIITTDDEEYVKLAKRFRHHGQNEKTRYEYHDLGYNYRMMDLQAAIALAQLRKIDEFTDKRIKNAELLTKRLKKIGWVKVPFVKKNVKHVFHQYTIKVDEKIRDDLIKHLNNEGVVCGVYYPKPLHMHPFFTKLGYKKGDFPIAEKLSKQVISLPVHPSVSEEDIDKIIKVLSEFKC